MIIVPDAWSVVRLGDLLEKQDNNRLLQQGWSPKCVPHPAEDDNTWAVLKTTAIQPGWFDPRQNKELPTDLRARPLIEVRSGDLLMTCAGPRSRCGIPALVRSTRPKLMMSGKMYRFRPIADLDASFLEFWLLSQEAQVRIDAMKTGISDSGLNLTQDRFLELPVPVPPRTEQHKIVEILEDHLSRLDTSATLLDDSRNKFAAVTASLSTDIVNQARRSSVDHLLGDHAYSVSYGTSAKTGSLAAETDVPVLRMGNIREGELDWKSLKYLAAEHPDINKASLVDGDLLFNRTNSAELVGKSAVFHGERSAALASYLIRVRFDERLLADWANIVINSPYGRSYIRSVLSQQVGQANVNGTKLRAFPIPVPPLKSQQADLVRFFVIREALNRLDRDRARIVARGVSLRRAVLAAAFSGTLTGQSTDAEVIEELAQ
ncbi:restriction endonuclease subunit S [Nakamurella sp. A5-74]|uniref:Restriction endonuclease subunit S n=1 Tax=Nakamurella sp. A5-74 TaxID=3158264 RepID=A0AAU8DPI9_9ACTN